MARTPKVEFVPVPAMARHHRRAAAHRMLAHSGFGGEEKRRAIAALSAQMAQGFIAREAERASLLAWCRAKASKRRQLRISRQRHKALRKFEKAR